MTTKCEPIPKEAFGKGCYFDGPRNTLYGANGVIYTDLQVSRGDFEGVCRELGIDLLPKDCGSKQ